MLPTRTMCLLIAVLSAAPSLGADGPSAPPSPAAFEHLTVNDGLPDNSVRAILQDRQGFLWLGTQNGLVRYDGQVMVPFGPRNEETGHTVNLATTSALEDRDGDLWIGTFATGLWRLSRRDNTFENWGDSEAESRRLGGLLIADICQADDGTIWVALGDGGLAGIDPATGSVQRLRRRSGDPQDAAPPEGPLAAVMQDRSGRLWVASEGGGLAVRSPGSARWHHFRHDPADPGSLPSDLVNAVHEDRAGRIWAATRRGLALWNPNSARFTVATPYPDDPDAMANYLVALDHDHRGRLWIGAAVGLYRFDPDSRSFDDYTHDPRRDDSLLRGPVLSVFCDASGIVWGGTWQVGLNKLDPDAHRFTSVGADPEDPGTLDFESVLAVLEDASGTLWVGTGDRSSGLSRGGLNSRLPGERRFRHHGFPADDPVQPTAVLALCEDPRGTLWIGTDRGLWQLPRGERQPRRTVYAAGAVPPLHDGNVSALCLGPGQELWIGTYGRGLFVLERDVGRLRHYVHDPADSTSLPQMHPICLHRDRRGRMWIGLDTRGLAIYDPQTDAFLPRFDPASGLASPVAMVEDTHGLLWVGALGGLFRLDDDGRVTRTITAQDGLPNDTITAVLPDGEGRLWLSTGRGLSRFTPETGEIKTYDERDGLPTSEAYTARWRGRDGTLYLGGRRGLVSFDPALVRDSEFIPPVVVTELRIADLPVLPGANSPLSVPVEQAKEVVLRHDQNDLTLSFAALHFARPERNRYRFRLAGVDDDWRESAGVPRAFYTNLAPGRYRFEVRGSNADGLWNPEPAVLAVRILPPWYRTTWAVLVYVLLALGLVTLIYRQVIQRERMRTALEVERAEARQFQELDALRSRFFANISHEFRTPLTLLLGPLQRLEREPESGDGALFAMMTRNARRLGQLIDQLLDLSRLEAGRLPLRWRQDDVCSFLRALVSPFAALAAVRDVTMISDHSGRSGRGLVRRRCAREGREQPALQRAEVHAGRGRRRGLRSPSRTPSSRGRSRKLPGATRRRARCPRDGCSSACSTAAPTFHRPNSPASSTAFISWRAAPGRAGRASAWRWSRSWWRCRTATVTVSSDPRAGTRFTVELPLLLAIPPGTRETSAPTDGATTAAALAELASPDDSEVAAAAAEAATVLVVEDNADLRNFVVRELAADYRVLTAADGEEGLVAALERRSRPRRLRRDDAGSRRPRAVPPPQGGPRHQPRAGDPAHRPGRSGEPPRGPRAGRRRLSRQALRRPRAADPDRAT